MKLTDRQKVIVGYYQLQADALAADGARDLGLREHIVRRELASLEKKGVIVPYPFIDLFRLGFVEHDLYFSIGSQPKKEVNQFLRYLAAASNISWLIEVGGPYQFGLSVLTRTVSEAHAVFAEISDRFPGMLLGRDFSVCFKWTLYRRRYLGLDLPAPKRLAIGQGVPIEALDSVDAAMLRALSSERYRKQRDLARAIKTPEATVGYRLARLRERKIFHGFVYSVECALFGLSSYRMHLWMRDFSSRGRQLIRGFAESNQNVTSLAERMGGPDFSMRLEVENSADVFAIGQELRELVGADLEKVEILPMLSERKINPYPFLSEHQS